MTPQRWEQIRQVFDGALERASKDRAAYLHAVCARDDELRREVLEQKDKRVIIDLSRVTRIDSAGLGQLMSCYSHLVKNRGGLKVLNPVPEVMKLLDMTGISTLIPAFEDEQEAVSSFEK